MLQMFTKLVTLLSLTGENMSTIVLEIIGPKAAVLSLISEILVQLDLRMQQKFLLVYGMHYMC